MADGSPVIDFEDCILRDVNGNEIKEWYALAAYLQSFGEEGVPARYAQPDGRKDVSRSWSPASPCRTAGAFSPSSATASKGKPAPAPPSESAGPPG